MAGSAARRRPSSRRRRWRPHAPQLWPTQRATHPPHHHISPPTHPPALHSMSSGPSPGGWGVMILARALLRVMPGRATGFDPAFGTAPSIIASMPGFLSLRLSRCMEGSNRYLLLVEWNQLEDHTEG